MKAINIAGTKLSIHDKELFNRILDDLKQMRKDGKTANYKKFKLTDKKDERK